MQLSVPNSPTETPLLGYSGCIDPSGCGTLPPAPRRSMSHPAPVQSGDRLSRFGASIRPYRLRAELPDSIQLQLPFRSGNCKSPRFRGFLKSSPLFSFCLISTSIASNPASRNAATVAATSSQCCSKVCVSRGRKKRKLSSSVYRATIFSFSTHQIRNHFVIVGNAEHLQRLVAIKNGDFPFSVLLFEGGLIIKPILRKGNGHLVTDQTKR